MQYKAAFESMGYKLASIRNDWTAAKVDGICVTIWKREIDWTEMLMDSRLHGGPVENWGHKPGNKRRISHARRAIDEFDGWVDAILISGKPGISYEDAQPWLPWEKGGRHRRIAFLDDTSGHIRLESHIR